MALIAAALAFQLLVRPIVGVADNGDFSRVAEPLGIFPPPEIGSAAYFDWILPEHRFDPARIWVRGLCCYSSATLFGAAALPVGRLISAPGRFDLRAIGIVNGLAFLGAIALLIVLSRQLPPRARILGGLLCFVILTDVAYVSFFNSFYTEPAVLVFLLGVIGLGVFLASRSDPPLWLPASFFLCAVLLATSRPQNALVGVLLALLGIRLAWPVGARHRRSLAVALAAATALLSLWYFRSTPAPLGQIHRYNAVFRELLPTSENPRGDLAQLGLPPELERLTGTSGFSPEARIAQERFREALGRVSFASLARFYVTRPTRLWNAFERSAMHAFELRPLNLGNYARTTGRPPADRSRTFAAWSGAKKRFLPARLWFVIVYLLVNTIVAVALRVRARSRTLRLAAEIWMTLVVLAAFQFAVSAVMDHDSRRSLFLFNVACDSLFVALCLFAAAGLRGLPRRQPAGARNP